MTVLGPVSVGPVSVGPVSVGPVSVGAARPAVDVPTDWVQALSVPGAERDVALRQLHQLLVRAARHQVWRMRGQLAGGADIDDIANQAADDALVAILGKLHTFAGRSRFTTWAYKFAIMNAAVQVRRQSWRDRDVPLEDADLVVERAPTPDAYAQASDLAAALATAIATVLTPHQRRIAVALLIDEVPVDVLAERLGTSRNAVYKTLFDARVTLRAHLRAAGYLPAVDSGPGAR
jgi:RNA polymerase sigma-70 factor (ECF subfamily)